MAFGEKEIEDLILPFYCVTANLTTANADIHTRRQAVALAARLGGACPACCRPSTTPARSMSTAA